MCAEVRSALQSRQHDHTQWRFQALLHVVEDTAHHLDFHAAHSHIILAQAGHATASGACSAAGTIVLLSPLHDLFLGFTGTFGQWL